MGFAESLQRGMALGLEAQRMQALQRQREQEMTMRKAMHALQVQQLKEARTQRMGDAQQKAFEEAKDVYFRTKNLDAAQDVMNRLAKTSGFQPLKFAHTEGEGTLLVTSTGLDPNEKGEKREWTVNPRQEREQKVASTAALMSNLVGLPEAMTGGQFGPQTPAQYKSQQIQEMFIQDPRQADTITRAMLQKQDMDRRYALQKSLGYARLAAMKNENKGMDRLKAQSALRGIYAEQRQLQQALADKVDMGERANTYRKGEMIPWMKSRKGAKGTPEGEQMIARYNQLSMEAADIRESAGIPTYVAPTPAPEPPELPESREEARKQGRLVEWLEREYDRGVAKKDPQAALRQLAEADTAAAEKLRRIETQIASAGRTRDPELNRRRREASAERDAARLAYKKALDEADAARGGGGGGLEVRNGKVHVRVKETGQPGWLPVAEYEANKSTYEPF